MRSIYQIGVKINLNYSLVLSRKNSVSLPNNTNKLKHGIFNCDANDYSFSFFFRFFMIIFNFNNIYYLNNQNIIQ